MEKYPTAPSVMGSRTRIIPCDMFPHSLSPRVPSSLPLHSPPVITTNLQGCLNATAQIKYHFLRSSVFTRTMPEIQLASFILGVLNNIQHAP